MTSAFYKLIRALALLEPEGKALNLSLLTKESCLPSGNYHFTPTFWNNQLGQIVKKAVNDLIDIEQNIRRERLRRFRSACGWILGALLLACGVAVRVSPMNVPVRLLLIVTFVFFAFTCAAFIFIALKKPSVAVFPAVFFIVLFVLWFVAANKPPDAESLRKGYYKRLRAYVASPFALGGETNLGIDSSGLARAALWQAMSREGIKEFNPRLLGGDMWRFWWRDMSAADIANGKYGYARPIGYAPKLAGYDTTFLEVGDMAITKNSHVIIYYGDEQWIEASSNDGKVVVNKAPESSKRHSFNMRVKLMRWRILEDR